MVIERLSFGEFYLFWPREVHRAAQSGSSLLPQQLDKLVHTVAKGFISRTEFSAATFPAHFFFFLPGVVSCRKSKKKITGVNKLKKKKLFSCCALDALVISEERLFHRGTKSWSLELGAYNCAPSCAEKGRRSPKLLIPCAVHGPRKTLGRLDQ